MNQSLQSREKFDAPWPMMEIRHALSQDTLDRDRLVLCCQPHSRVYAEISFREAGLDHTGHFVAQRRRDVLGELSARALARYGWLWWTRMRLMEVQAGATEVHSIPTTKATIICGPNDIGWPGAEAHKNQHVADAFQLMLGIGSDAARDWWSLGIDKWTTVGIRDPAEAVAAQAFIANLRSASDRWYRRTPLVELKPIAKGLKMDNGPWRAPVYDVAELMCAAYRNDVFHADEEMTWTMFLNKRRP